MKKSSYQICCNGMKYIVMKKNKYGLWETKFECDNERDAKQFIRSGGWIA